MTIESKVKNKNSKLIFMLHLREGWQRYAAGIQAYSPTAKPARPNYANHANVSSVSAKSFAISKIAFASLNSSINSRIKFCKLGCGSCTNEAWRS